MTTKYTYPTSVMNIKRELRRDFVYPSSQGHRILDSVKASNYQENRQALVDWIEQAKVELRV